MDFKTREVTFRLTDASQFNEEAVNKALKGQGFPGTKAKSGPS
jgi:hypothetical protein